MPLDHFFALLLLAFLLTIGGPVVSAATFTVTKTNDTNDGVCDADCSLREAAAAAATVALTAIDSEIVFSPLLSGQSISVTNGEVSLVGVAVRGPGADQLTIAANNISRVFFVPGSISTQVSNYAALSGVTVTGGNGVGTGPTTGATAGGGAIRAEGNFSLVDVSIIGSTTLFGVGSALFTSANGDQIRNCFFGNNSGYGVYAYGGAVIVTNSTFAGNSSGAIYIHASSVSIVNSTLFDSINTSNLGGVGLSNSIVRRIDNLLGLSSAGHNLIFNPNPGENPGFYHPTDLRGVDPLLGPLQLNGGKTASFSLLAGSPAIDGGENARAIGTGIGIDQRRFGRIVDGNGDTNAVVDIGAYEYNAAPVSPISFAGRLRTPAGVVMRGAMITITDSEGNTGSVKANPFGYFRFQNIYVGRIVVNTAEKRLGWKTFTFFATENVSNADLLFQ